MKITVTLDWKGDRASDAVRKGLAEGLTKGAEILADQMVRIMGTDHGGVPSTPGNPPNVQTSHLRNSIGYVPATPDSLVAFAGTNVIYGKYLEDGTSKMAPRPWALPSMRLVKDQITAVVNASVAKALNGGVE